jgi:hypothetical protein
MSGTSYQTMVGWQASCETGYIESIASYPNWHNAALDANVDIGINAVRIGLHSGIAENSTDYYGNFLANGQDSTVGNGVALWQAVKDHWRIPINDNADPNTTNASGYKWAMVDWQIDKCVVPLRNKLAARGEQLYWTITYVHFSTSNQLHVDTPAEYGELILALWQHLQSRYGFFPNGLEIYLEPDNGAAQVSPSELAAMIVAARNRLINAGYTKPEFIAPSTVSGPNAAPFYLSLKTANVVAASYIDIVGYHRYVDIDDILLGNLRLTAQADGKRTGMNEYTGATYLNLHSDLSVGRVSIWEQYALAFQTIDNGDQYFVIGPAPGYALTIGNKTKFIQHYTRYIRRGAVMKGVTNQSSNFQGLPFRNANGTYVVPIKASAAGTITVEGLPAGVYGIRYTTGSSYNIALPNQTVASGGQLTFNIPASGVATVFDLNYLAP